MATYVFDIETNGLYADLTKLHCLVLRDVDSNQVYSYGPSEIEHGLRQMMEADKLIAHNGIGFDIPAISKVYPEFSVERSRVFDTLIISRLAYPDLSGSDVGMIQTGKLDKKYRGSHSLAAWGNRMGVLKGEFGQSTDWSEWSQEMQEYCEQDTGVTLELWKLLSTQSVAEEAQELEHAVAWIISEQTRHGIKFDRTKAQDLLRRLVVRRAELDAELQTVFDPWYSAVEEKTPDRAVNYKDPSRHSTWAGATYTVIKANVFNANSRQMIANRLMALYGWKPKKFTETGLPKIDEDVLGGLPYKEAQVLAEAMMLQKRISQLGDGDNAWLNMLDADDRIHGDVNTNGTVSGRMSHNRPNLAQVPSHKKPYGKECRELFTVPPGKKMVGVDVSGLELRMLGHFLARHDGGAYGNEVVSGDIHTANQNAAGLPTRDHAKTFIYAFLYGAGADKIGSIVGGGSKQGQALKTKFLEATPAISSLLSEVQRAAGRGYLKGLDGRQLHIRSLHSALNTLLQSAGALVCKQWAVEMDRELERQGLKGRCQVVANIHDEHQYECDEDIAEHIGKLSVACIKKAGEHFKLKVQLDGEYKIGNNWSETH